MKIPLELLASIVATVGLNEVLPRKGKDLVLKFDLLESTETADTHTLKIIEVYFDRKDGWVLDTKEKSK